VDIITFGSPCQDLSVAGKRAGLKHEANGDEETTRSGLFMEAVRIIKEMRKATDGRYPTFAIWENVPGAFSSNKGEDFRIVLEELIKISEPDAIMPGVPKKGWAYSDSFCGDKWSLAYRVFDAQYWGVPQRRRRIYLVLDLGGQCAREVLFERKGLRGHLAKSRTQGETVTRDTENGIGTADCERKSVALAPVASTLRAGAGAPKHESDVVGRLAMEQVPYLSKIRSGCEGGGKGALIQTDMSATLATNNDQYLFQPVVYDARGNGDGEICPTITGDHNNRVTDYTTLCVEPLCVIASSCVNAEITDGSISPCLCARAGTGGNNVPMICLEGNGSRPSHLGNGWAESGTMYTLNATEHHAVAYAMQGFGDYKDAGVCSGLKARDYKDATDLVVENKQTIYRQGGFAEYIEGEAGTIRASGGDLGGGSENLVVSPVQYIVRRLTPTECARLQGFVDCWGHPDKKDDFTDEEYEFWLNVRNTHAAINEKQVKDYTKAQMLTWYNKLHTDSSEYKLWGNGIALPNALYVMEGIEDVLKKERDKC
jgi:DNA (cytosine-5)-methyltransferase 1